MIVAFMKQGSDGTEELARFEINSKLPGIGDKVRLNSKVFKVKDLVYEFFGRNDRTSTIEILMEDLG